MWKWGDDSVITDITEGIGEISRGNGKFLCWHGTCYFAMLRKKLYCLTYSDRFRGGAVKFITLIIFSGVPDVDDFLAMWGP